MKKKVFRLQNVRPYRYLGKHITALNNAHRLWRTNNKFHFRVAYSGPSNINDFRKWTKRTESNRRTPNHTERETPRRRLNEKVWVFWALLRRHRHRNRRLQITWCDSNVAHDSCTKTFSLLKTSQFLNNSKLSKWTSARARIVHRPKTHWIHNKQLSPRTSSPYIHTHTHTHSRRKITHNRLDTVYLIRTMT